MSHGGVYWAVLILSGALESVWAVALDKSENFSRPGPSVLFVIALALSMAGLSYGMRGIPLGTAYAVWVGIGACLTVGYGMVVGAEPASLLKVGFVALIVAGVVGLKLTG